MTLSIYYFFINETAPTWIYMSCHPPSLHDALPSFLLAPAGRFVVVPLAAAGLQHGVAVVAVFAMCLRPCRHLVVILVVVVVVGDRGGADRKSTRLNSSH